MPQQEQDINIIGVNSLNLAFEREREIKFKHNSVVFLGDDKHVSELENSLLITGVAMDVKVYDYEEVSDSQLLLDYS